MSFGRFLSSLAATGSFTLFLITSCGERLGSTPGGVPTSVATVDLQIGSLLEDGPESFGFIGGVLSDPEGRILVADYQANEVRVFDYQGVFQFAFGRGGSGPGEFQGPCCLAFGPEGRLWVRDGGNHRYSAFALGDNGADPVSTLEMVHSDINFMAPLTFTETGQLIDIGHRPSESGGPALVRFVVSPAGRPLDSIVVPGPDPSEIGMFEVPRETSEGTSVYFFYQPFAPRQLVAHGADGRWASGLGSEYLMRLHADSRTIEIQREATAVPLSDEERERAVGRIEADAKRVGRRPGQLPYGIPDTKPVIRAAFFDSAGRLWIEKHGEEGSPRTADLWDENGDLVKQVVWPDEISLEPPAWVGEDWGLGILRDSLGVQYIARVRF